MALYISRGTISELSEVKSGTSLSGNNWQRMQVVLEIPGFQGQITRQVFSVFGDKVNEVLNYKVGEKVEIAWSMYAREWNGNLYNNVELVKITQAGGDPVETKLEHPRRSPIYDKIQAKAAPAQEYNPANDLPF